MKNLKKLFSLLLVVMLLFSTVILSSADEDPIGINDDDLLPKGEITINDKGADGVYNGYMLINSTNSQEYLTRYAYTVNEKYIDILYSVTQSVTEEEASKVDVAVKHESVLVYLERFEHDSTDTRIFADKVYRAIQKSDLEPDKVFNGGERTQANQGYWLLADVTDLNRSTDCANSLVMIDTIGVKEIEVKVKKGVPTVFKKVYETDDCPDGSLGTVYPFGWQDAADYDIGDVVSFKDTGTVSEIITSFEEYFYGFHNTIENLTYVDGSYKVTIDGKDYTSEFTVEWNNDTKKLDIYINDLLSIKDEDGKPVIKPNSVIVLEYDAVLDDTAVTGSNGNSSIVVIEYSNNPYDTDSRGFTAEDKVVVFTYQIIVNKIIGTDETPDTPDTPDTAGKPMHKNAIAVPGIPLRGAEFTLYKLNDKNEYVKVGKPIVIGTQFIFKGIDRGVYKLVETRVPDGFNKADDLEFIVTATYDVDSENPMLRDLAVFDLQHKNITASPNNKEAVFAVDLSTGSLITYVKNYSGTKMPSAGGVGTVLLYVIGGILFVGASILLIKKLRKKTEAK